MKTVLFSILAVLAVIAEGSEPTITAPKIGIDQAIALATEAASSNPAYQPKVLFCRSAVLTEKLDLGLVWILEFECKQVPQQPLPEDIKVDANNLITPWFFQVRINMDGGVAGYYVAHYKAKAKHDVPTAYSVLNKRGFCISPYSGPRSGYMDVRGAQPGEIVRCPYTGLPVVVPEPSTQ